MEVRANRKLTMTQDTSHWGNFVRAQVHMFGELVVGIDPVLEDMPLCFEQKNERPSGWLDSYVEFVLDTISGEVGFVKFQSAFFEACGAEGVRALADGISKAKSLGLGVILDAKRGDIDSTSAAYGRAYLTPRSAGGNSDLEVDCMTINPFLGPETLEPFVNCARMYGKGLFILAKTSNPGAIWLQDKIIDGKRVSDRIAEQIASWAEETVGDSGLSTIGAVVGATFPEDGRRLRTLMPNSIFLAPGVGAQGGSLDSIHALRRQDGSGILVPVSRGITKVPDRDLSESAYAELIRNRIAHYRKTLE